jgi:hypothetical protein
MRRTFRSATSLNPAERDLARALVDVVGRHGKFANDGDVYADYREPADNDDVGIGVRCGNCVLYRPPSACRIVDAVVEPDGICRFAVIPDGVVTSTTGQ